MSSPFENEENEFLKSISLTDHDDFSESLPQKDAPKVPLSSPSEIEENEFLKSILLTDHDDFSESQPQKDAPKNSFSSQIKANEESKSVDLRKFYLQNSFDPDRLSFLNDKYPRLGDDYWNFSKNNYHFQNSIEIANLLNKIIHICSSSLPLKDVLADLNLQELIVNIIQSQNRLDLDQLSETKSNSNASPLAYITGFIKANINEDIKLGVLSEKACMSKATFYRSFKKEYGISPLEYIISEKIKLAKKLLADPKNTLKFVAFECGFHDVNYFVRLFKKMESITPGQYQQLLFGATRKA